MVDALAMIGDERRDSLRKASGSWQISFDPEMSEWGNPPLVMECVPPPEHIGRLEGTGGIETSQYPEERKATATP